MRRITKELLDGVGGIHVAVVTATEPGVVAGIDLLDAGAAPDPAGTWQALRVDGDVVDVDEPIVEVTGTAWELAVAEDHVLGALGWSGGVARRARELRSSAPDDLHLVCGGWKKLPAPLKPLLRAALSVAGLGHRLVDGDFVYIDKNVAHLAGGMAAAVGAGRSLGHGPVAVQVTSLDQARTAVTAGCGIVMVDTGDLGLLAAVDADLRASGRRPLVEVAFAGGVTAASLGAARSAGADIVDIGRAVLDAPLWDLHLQLVR